MKKFLLFIALLISLPAFATNYYVTPSGGVSTPQNGTDWNHAWVGVTGISWGSVHPGDTIWLAGGPYSGTLFYSASGTAGNPITVKLATSSDAVPVAAAGWSSSFNQHATIAGAFSGGEYSGVAFNFQNYVTLDGNVNAGPYGGILIGPVPPGQENNCGVVSTSGGFNRSGPNHTGVTCQYVAVVGANYGGVLTSGTPGGTAFMFNENGQTYNTNSYIGHCLSDGCNIAVYTQGTVNLIVEYCRFNNIIGCACGLQPHNNMWLPYDGQNCIWRYNIAYNIQGQAFEFGAIGQGEGPFFGTQIYGNVIDGGLFNGGVQNFITHGAMSGFYNNTLVSIGLAMQSNDGTPISFPVTNNIFYWTTSALSYNQDSKSDYNTYSATTSGGNGSLGSPETHSIVNSANPFVNVTIGTYNTNQDYHLKSGAFPINKGAALTANGFFNVDMDGTSRNGAWSIGAYEFGSAPPVCTTPLLAVSATSLSFGAIQTNTTASLSMTITNVCGGTLTGTASTAAPFTVTAGASYSLTSNQTQTITVRYNPTSVSPNGGDTGSLVLTGGGGFVVPLSGSGYPLLPTTFASTNGPLLTGWTVSNAFLYATTEVSDPVSGAQAVYHVKIPATGNYCMTNICISDSEAHNSYYVNFDGPSFEPTNVCDLEPNSAVPFAYPVSWRGPNGTFTNDQFIPNYWFLTAGTHVLNVGSREPYVLIGQFSLSVSNFASTIPLAAPTHLRVLSSLP